jgi:hypothetical protein
MIAYVLCYHFLLIFNPLERRVAEHIHSSRRVEVQCLDFYICRYVTYEHIIFLVRAIAFNTIDSL